MLVHVEAEAEIKSKVSPSATPPCLQKRFASNEIVSLSCSPHGLNWAGEVERDTMDRALVLTESKARGSLSTGTALLGVSLYRRPRIALYISSWHVPAPSDAGSAEALVGGLQ